ncbi:hypothetical protein P3T26_003587 [Streptomyces sp. MAA16]|nr:hypothetical protein [Streptomyces sp. MAA16]
MISRNISSPVWQFQARMVVSSVLALISRGWEWAGWYRRRLPASLNELVGPEHRRVDLPLHIAWSGLRTLDLDLPRQRMSLYRTVLAEGMRDDLCRSVPPARRSRRSHHNCGRLTQPAGPQVKRPEQGPEPVAIHLRHLRINGATTVRPHNAQSSAALGAAAGSRRQSWGWAWSASMAANRRSPKAPEA